MQNLLKGARHRVACAAAQLAGNYCRATPVVRQLPATEIPVSFTKVLEHELHVDLKQDGGCSKL